MRFLPLYKFVSGDIAAKTVAETQPAKIAAMEGHWETSSHAPFHLFGFPDEKTETTKYSIEIPYALSFLAHGDITKEVVGLKSIDKDKRPPVLVVHIAFQIMIACGLFMMFTMLWAVFLKIRKKELVKDKLLLWLSVICTPLGFIALEAGWTVTEVGRQPYIINGIMLTKDAVTKVPVLAATFILFLLIYFILFVAVIYLMKRQVISSLGVGDDTTNA